MVAEVRLGQSVLYRGHGTSCPEVQVEDSRRDDDGGEPNVLLPWLRNWPAAFAALQLADAACIRALE